MLHRAAAVFLLVGSGIASASPALRLEVEGDCKLDALADQTSQLLGRDPFDVRALEVVHVRTRLVDQGASAELAVDTADERVLGPRTLEASDCDHLAAAVAVVLATAIPELPSDATPTPLAVSDVSPRLAPPEKQAVAPNPVTFDAIAGVASTLSSDGSHAGATAALRVRRQSRSIELGLEVRASSELRLPNMMTRVNTTPATLAVRPCQQAGSIALCAIGAAGWISGDAAGVVAASPAALPIVQIGTGATWEHPLGDRFAVRARAEVRANVLGARFEIDQMAVWSSARVEAWFGIDAVARIP